jgi:predicted transcriptional regulator
MTKLLIEVLEELRKRPAEEQNEAAELLSAFLANRGDPEELDEETLVAIRRGVAQADRGEFATDEEMDELFRRFDA